MINSSCLAVSGIDGQMRLNSAVIWSLIICFCAADGQPAMSMITFTISGMGA